MFKYLILAFVGYFIYINYLVPKLNTSKKENSNSQEQKMDGDYVDYEEIK